MRQITATAIAASLCASLVLTEPLGAAGLVAVALTAEGGLRYIIGRARRIELQATEPSFPICGAEAEERQALALIGTRRV